MSKKIILLTAILGLTGFAGMFAFAWFTKPVPPLENTETGEIAMAGQETGLNLRQLQMSTVGSDVTVDSAQRKAMTEKQLRSLVFEVREKIQEYDDKLRSLEIEEQRLQATHNILKKDIEKLGSLQIELVSTVASLKSEQDKLSKSRIEIATNEKNNLISLAAAYDKMDATSAGTILTNISQSQSSSSDDAVKILHYMSERPKAKVLASIAEVEPAISASFCQELKQITEKE